MEFSTKKVPREADLRLRKFQAKYMLRAKKRISEGAIIIKALKVMEKHEDEMFEFEEEGRHSISDLFGKLKGGPRFNATKELDDIVYGKV